ncbi:MAG TPA: DUF6261 family protein [Paludibacter sp.]
MKVKIIRISLKNFRNSEYTIFVSQLVAIFMKYNAELLHLKKSFERLKAFIPDLEKIKAQELSSAYSTLIHDLDVQRDNLFNAIVNQVKNIEKSGLASLAGHVAVLNRLLDKHGRDIATVNYNAETKRLNDLLAEISSSTEISAAIAATNLNLFVDELRAVNTEFNSKFMQRTEDDAAIEVVDARAIRTESDKELIAFFEAFEFCSSEYDGLDYQTPANELNEHISYYKTQLKARDTRRANGKDITSETPIAEKVS